MIDKANITVDEVGIVASDLLVQLYQASFEGSPEQSWKKKDFDQLFAVPGTTAFIVSNTEGPAGFLLIRELGDEAEIITFCILPKWCNNGYATHLLEWVIKRLQLRNINRLFLEVRENNQAAVGLYKKCSFKIIGRRKGYYQSSEQGKIDALVMQNDLNV